MTFSYTDRLGYLSDLIKDASSCSRWQVDTHWSTYREEKKRLWSASLCQFHHTYLLPKPRIGTKTARARHGEWHQCSSVSGCNRLTYELIAFRTYGLTVAMTGGTRLCKIQWDKIPPRQCGNGSQSLTHSWTAIGNWWLPNEEESAIFRVSEHE